eukprot:6466902-Amphidinium_carterae.1
MLAKPDGSFRPIGLTALIMRVWAKMRVAQLRAWETSAFLPSFWRGRHRCADLASYAYGLHVEGALARGL